MLPISILFNSVKFLILYIMLYKIYILRNSITFSKYTISKTLHFTNGRNHRSGSMLSARLVIVPTTIQEASTQDTRFNFEQNQENKCSNENLYQ